MYLIIDNKELNLGGDRKNQLGYNLIIANKKIKKRRIALVWMMGKGARHRYITLFSIIRKYKFGYGIDETNQIDDINEIDEI